MPDSELRSSQDHRVAAKLRIRNKQFVTHAKSIVRWATLQPVRTCGRESCEQVFLDYPWVLRNPQSSL